jgi:hypothetical protein
MYVCVVGNGLAFNQNKQTQPFNVVVVAWLRVAVAGLVAGCWLLVKIAVKMRLVY